MKTLILKTSILTVVAVSLLTLVCYRTLVMFLFYLLYPGMIINVLITGGHGGTIFEEWAGAISGVLVNTVCYMLAFGLLFLVWRRLRKRSKNHADRRPGK